MPPYYYWRFEHCSRQRSKTFSTKGTKHPPLAKWTRKMSLRHL